MVTRVLSMKWLIRRYLKEESVLALWIHSEEAGQSERTAGIFVGETRKWANAVGIAGGVERAMLMQ